jgi:hypothetical protein
MVCDQATDVISVTLGVIGSNEPRKRTNICLNCIEKPGVKFITDFGVVTTEESAQGSFRKKRSVKEERKTAQEVGGRRTKASGATFHDGDVLNKDWMIEEKLWASAKTLSNLTASIVNKAVREANRNNRTMALRIKLPAINLDLAVMLWSDALQFIRDS